MTPEHHQQAILQAGRSVMHDASSRLDQATHVTRSHANELAALIGSARQQDRQLQWLIVTGAAALIAGLLISPIFARLLPFGLDGRVAAVIMRGDRWDAGADLMQAGNPEAWRSLMAAHDLSKANREALAACRDAAAKTNKDQHCTVVVQALAAPRS